MANYTGASRTNYFSVKDEAAFRAWAEKFGLELIEQAGLFGVLPSTDSDTGLFHLANDEEEDGDPLDICDEIAAHLAEGSIAVIVEAGHEKLRYVGGWATAINYKGERGNLCLDDICDLAKKHFGIEPTPAAS